MTGSPGRRGTGAIPFATRRAVASPCRSERDSPVLAGSRFWVFGVRMQKTTPIGDQTSTNRRCERRAREASGESTEPAPVPGNPARVVAAAHGRWRGEHYWDGNLADWTVTRGTGRLRAVAWQRTDARVPVPFGVALRRLVVVAWCVKSRRRVACPVLRVHARPTLTPTWRPGTLFSLLPLTSEL